MTPFEAPREVFDEEACNRQDLARRDGRHRARADRRGNRRGRAAVVRRDLRAAPSGNGYDFVPTQNVYFWTAVALFAAGSLIAFAGAIVQFAAWIAALVNSYQLPDKAWLLVTLILGLLGFGLIIMIVYLIAAPDG